MAFLFNLLKVAKKNDIIPIRFCLDRLDKVCLVLNGRKTWQEPVWNCVLYQRYSPASCLFTMTTSCRIQFTRHFSVFTKEVCMNKEQFKQPFPLLFSIQCHAEREDESKANDRKGRKLWKKKKYHTDVECLIFIFHCERQICENVTGYQGATLTWIKNYRRKG